MASNILSRWRRADTQAASIYETIRQHDEDSEPSDAEDHTGLAIDEQNLQEDFHDLESNASSHFDVTGWSQRRSDSRDLARGGRASRTNKRSNQTTWTRTGHKLLDVEEADDDVPASLLIEGNDIGLGRGSISLPPPPSAMIDELSPRNQGGNNQRIQNGRPHLGSRSRFSSDSARPSSGIRPMANLAGADPREVAMWRWTNVINLDNFLSDVYDYYVRHGFWSILLTRVFGMLTSAFVVGFSLFLTQCVNYAALKNSSTLSQILVNKCTRRMGFIPNLLLWLFTFAWICKIFQYAIDIQRLRHIHDFYLYLLNVSEDEIQSISWQEVVSRLMALRDSNPTVASNTSAKSRRYATTQSKQRMDAHDIANRLMRKDNYMIAMVNKEILDMTLPIPLLRNRQLFTRTLEWNLNWCVMDYVFNEKGQIRPLFLKDTHRRDLSEGLRRRFVFAGTANLVIAPFLIIFFLFQNFFIYFNEYQKNPSQLGTRQYNAFAEWKFREFNELWHLFQRRINMSHPFAMRYINQFPKDKTVQAARFVTFISGAIVSVLGLATIFDQENFLSFEITPGRTTIFYIGLFGGIWAVARGLLPDENMVYDTAYSMGEVIEFTHYEPTHWKNRLHTVEVKKEFEQLYQMKIAIFVEEVLSMIFTPFVLWFSLPKCSDRIIDFVREFTVHVDGIGYVCSFAEFKLRKPLEAPVATSVGREVTSEANITEGEALREDYYSSRDHKLEQSYWGFMNDYARNPKTDVRFPYGGTRRRLNMPPPAPGLLSPTLQAGAFDAPHHSIAYTSGRQQGSNLSPQRAAFPSETSKHGPQTSTSPLQSLLLDPHHQPSASGYGIGGSRAIRPSSSRTVPGAASAFARAKRRSAQNIHLPADIVEQDTPMATSVDPSALNLDDVNESLEQTRQSTTNSAVAAAGGRGMGTGTMMGELGSWKYDDERSDTSEDEDAQAIANDGVGVLGLIKQFQKAQSEGRKDNTTM